MPPTKTKIPGVDGYRELLQALENDGRRIECVAMEMIEKIDRMLADDSLDSIQSLARESVVKVPGFAGIEESYLVVKCNERLESLVECVRHEGHSFTEHAETIRGLIDLQVMYENRIDYETQLSWKNELVQMQGQISANQMDICSYYRQRSDIGLNVLKQPRVSDYWEQLVEIDQDFFYKLRTILFDLRTFYLRLFHIVHQWMHCSEKIS